ncbi:MAG: branched-chain amino acid ABC transporter permease [Paracoccaceae bacterium]|nr:branched-chain amino acid ABC transporter permease [Paracoccaceae bacterium]
MFLQHLADGILSGAVVSLGAIGLSFTMKILRFANFSHSELLTWGAYSALIFLSFATSFGGTFDQNIGPFSFGVPLLISMVFACVVTSAIALFLHRFIFERLSRKAGHMTMVFASFGVALILRHLVVLIWGSDPIYFSNDLQFAVLLPGNVRVMPDQVFLLSLTIVVVVALHLFMTRTRTGIAMRGVSESPDLARISGVNVNAIINWVWVLGASGAALGGVLYGMTVQLRPELGFGLILPLFAAAILGGAGSLYGAVIGGLIVGISENLSVMIIPTNYKPSVPFLLILAILYCRPHGLFGERPQ